MRFAHVSDLEWPSKGHMSDVVMFWPKSRIMSPFLSRARSYMAENAISAQKGQSLLHLWRDSSVTWHGRLFCYQLCEACPISPAKFQRDPSRSLMDIKKLMWGGGYIPPVPARVNVFNNPLNGYHRINQTCLLISLSLKQRKLTHSLWLSSKRNTKLFKFPCLSLSYECAYVCNDKTVKWDISLQGSRGNRV